MPDSAVKPGEDREHLQNLQRGHRAAFVARKARAILDYLDFKPIEALTTRGVLAAAARG